MNKVLFPRCQIEPLPDHQVALRIDRVEKARWHYGREYPRPFFFPINGPSGNSLTRMGHPGAPNHDHHRSVWFAHEKVVGVNFWSDLTDSQIRQLEWLDYVDGDQEALMGMKLGWFDGHDPKPLLEQTVLAALIPARHGEWSLELQIVLKPVSETLEFGKSNFGFLAVRVAKSLSAHFGDGKLTNSEGRFDEPRIFGQKARWVDYSGSVTNKANGKPVTEGITYFDHPANAGYPHRWHVREDGWMGNSHCFDGPQSTARKDPLTLRYLLHIHQGPYDAEAAKQVAEQFATRPAMQVEKSKKKHRQYEVSRKSG